MLGSRRMAPHACSEDEANECSKLAISRCTLEFPTELKSAKISKINLSLNLSALRNTLSAGMLAVAGTLITVSATASVRARRDSKAALVPSGDALRVFLLLV